MQDDTTTDTTPRLRNPSSLMPMVEWYDPVKPGQPPEWERPTLLNSKLISTTLKLMALVFVSWVAFVGGIALVGICILVGGPWMFASFLAAGLIAAVTYQAVKLLPL